MIILPWRAALCIVGCSAFISGLHPLDPRSITHASCNNQKGFRTLANNPLSCGERRAGGGVDRIVPVGETLSKGRKEKVVLPEARVIQGHPGKAGTMRQRGLSSERGREKRPWQKGKGRNTLASLLPLNLLQTGTAFLTYRANQRQGMVLRMQAQDQYKDYLKTVILNKDTNLNLRSNFETGAHSMRRITR